MPTPSDILSRYWGYGSFRPRQEEIIESVLSGHDTLGLLPTGGGKSLTFQVPALALPGLTLVITPLISLMKDQVDNLRRRDIRAAAVHSGLSRSEFRLAVDRARLGKIKLLYLSPEKLLSPAFIDTLRLFDVSMIVVDEAHCISQWGYDFRPSYLKIAEVRSLFPKAPVLALTASATPEVAMDIGRQLRFTDANIYVRSFERENISYIVRYADHKEEMLTRVLRATSGSAIVYVRSRRRTRETAAMLSEQGITAEYYHAGLSPQEKDDKQNRWRDDQVRVMVATNAFGMGIDKPDVRTVVHIDLPSSLEEYYQEAGRAGRDGNPSYAVLIASPRDKATLTRRLNESFPDKEFIRRVYELAGNFVDVAVGSGYNHIYEFDFPLFCERFKLPTAPTLSALRLLTRAGYFEYIEQVETRSRVMITCTKNELYDVHVDPVSDSVLEALLRSYTGLFADYVPISEELLADRLSITVEQVYQSMLTLRRAHALNYIPRSSTPYLYYTTSRELPKHVVLPRGIYEDMRDRMKTRLDAMRDYVFDSSRCRVEIMLRYFGQRDARPCGKCDVCRGKQPSQPRDADTLRNQILYLAGQPGGHTIEYIARQLGCKTADLIAPIREMADEGEIAVSPSGNITTL